MCISLSVDGHRPDTIIAKTAKTIAAFEGRKRVEPEDVFKASLLALGHRTRKKGTAPPATYEDIKRAYEASYAHIKHEIEREKKESTGELVEAPQHGGGGEREKIALKGKKLEFSGPGKKVKSPFFRKLYKLFARLRKKLKAFWVPSPVIGEGGIPVEPKGRKDHPDLWERKPAEFDFFSGIPMPLAIAELSQIPSLPLLIRKTVMVKAKRLGRRVWTISETRTGRYVRYRIPETLNEDIALLPTIKSAVLRGSVSRTPPVVRISPSDVREKVRACKTSLLVIMVVDMSESMKFYAKAIAEAVLTIQQEGRRKRDRFALIAFKGREARIICRPTRNLSLISLKIASLGMSGFTPLAAGLLKAMELVRIESRKNRDTLPVVVLITDGKANVPLPVPLFPTSGIRALEEPVHVASLLGKMGVPVVVVAPVGHPAIVRLQKIISHSPSAELCERIAKESGGICIFIPCEKTDLGRAIREGIERVIVRPVLAPFSS